MEARQYCIVLYKAFCMPCSLILCAGLKSCAGPSPGSDACCGSLRGVQYAIANADPHSFLAVITNPNLNTPCRYV